MTSHTGLEAARTSHAVWMSGLYGTQFLRDLEAELAGMTLASRIAAPP